jgi:L-aspartate oxidase
MREHHRVPRAWRHTEPACPGSALSQVQQIAWEKCGIVRHAAGLGEACRLLASLPGSEAEVALLIARCALAREESRGAHFRADFPEKHPQFAKHSVVQKDAGISFR